MKSFLKVKVKTWVRGLVFGCVNGWVIVCASKRFVERKSERLDDRLRYFVSD